MFDHIHRRDAQSEGIQHYPQRSVGSHENYTRDIAQSMEAKVEESTKNRYNFWCAKAPTAQRIYVPRSGRGCRSPYRRNQQKASMTANKIDELIPFETYKGRVRGELHRRIPITERSLPEQFYTRTHRPGTCGRLTRQPRCFAKFCSFKGRDMDPWVGFKLGLPLGKEQIGNEQKGFGVRHACELTFSKPTICNAL